MAIQFDLYQGPVVGVDDACWVFSDIVKGVATKTIVDIQGYFDGCAACNEIISSSSSSSNSSSSSSSATIFVPPSSSSSSSSSSSISSSSSSSNSSSSSSNSSSSSSSNSSSSSLSSSSSISSSSSSSSVAGSSSSSSSSTSSTPFVPSLNCGGGTQPSMVLTVSGHSGDVTWCGETWTFAEQGTPKEVCPDSSTAWYSTSFNFGHTWRKNSYDLFLVRMKLFSGGMHRIVVRDSDAFPTFWLEDWRGYLGIYTQMIGIITPYSPFVAPTDYIIPVSWRTGSINSAGVTYTWSPGTNWPP